MERHLEGKQSKFKKFLSKVKQTMEEASDEAKKRWKLGEERRELFTKPSHEIISLFRRQVDNKDVPLYLYGIKTNNKGLPCLQYNNIKVFQHIHYTYTESSGRGSSAGYRRARMYSSHRVSMRKTVDKYELESGFHSLVFDESGSFLNLSGKKYSLTSCDSIDRIPFEDREIEVLVVNFVQDGQRVRRFIEVEKPDFQRVLIKEFTTQLLQWKVEVRDVEKHLVHPSKISLQKDRK